MLTPEVIEVPFLSFPSPCKRPWGEGEERNVGTSITSFSSFSCLLFLCQRTQRKDRKKSTRYGSRARSGEKLGVLGSAFRLWAVSSSRPKVRNSPQLPSTHHQLWIEKGNSPALGWVSTTSRGISFPKLWMMSAWSPKGALLFSKHSAWARFV